VYHAAIRDPDAAAKVAGGIGIVFDAEPEFAAMLRGALAEKAGMTGLFIDRSGRVIASTDPTRPVGSTLDIDPALLKLPNGSSASRIVIHDGHYAIMGCTVSNGYREFKVSDGYTEDVIAVVYECFGEVREAAGNANRSDCLIESDVTASGGMEYATFFVGGDLFALPAVHVAEALPASEISPVSMGGRSERIGVLALEREGGERKFVWVFDLAMMMHGVPTAIEAGSQVIVVDYQGRDVGILVGELHGVPEFQPAQVVPTPFASQADGLLVKQVIKANGGRLLIQAMDVAQLFACLLDPSLPVLLKPADVERVIAGLDADLPSLEKAA
jgi:chemotaxis signal transduction protein